MKPRKVIIKAYSIPKKPTMNNTLLTYGIESLSVRIYCGEINKMNQESFETVFFSLTSHLFLIYFIKIIKLVTAPSNRNI